MKLRQYQHAKCRELEDSHHTSMSLLTYAGVLATSPYFETEFPILSTSIISQTQNELKAVKTFVKFDLRTQCH